MRLTITLIALASAAVVMVAPAGAQSFFFDNDNPDGRIATASRPEDNSNIEIESADDFVIQADVALTHATFTGLLPSMASLNSIDRVRVEIYRVFPKDSNNPPSGNVPTRNNSPSDVAFVIIDSADGSLTFSATLLNANFNAANSVVNGIFKKPNQHTGGEGAVSGEEVRFAVDFNPPIQLPADHYFFIPQVHLTSGNFLWLSAPKPAAPPALFTDLQSWIRNANLDPDWLRIGTDIVDGAPLAPQFNGAFSLTGNVVTGAPALGDGAIVVLGLSLALAGTLVLRRRSTRAVQG